ncbi:hypothetical protein [Fredinandcohnia quinoae]|uniref:Hydrolase n=1 Tax=Fredinandcohnia quinoae TaxID=2918902 RepID=A0AAW5E9T1_9BACI|nr:hypothetical protein [Fredinandcohnia sp. SECRCQ15]MCH1625878.1 hypothetical protein [Fredinandcohnia sp. SECRCQ15]
MDQNQRFFQVDMEWSVIHLPERPNGFGVLIIGDKNNFVDKYTSFWMQNPGRKNIIEYLQKEGYTIFYSNLYGVHWGSSKALKLAVQLCHMTMKREILNERIHIFAEGMGALVALQLMNKIENKIRSVALLNPCIDLLAHIEYEKNNKFFYKRLIKELAAAFEINDKEAMIDLERYIPNIDYHSPNTPVRIWQNTTDKTYQPEIHTRMYKEIRQSESKQPIVSYHVNEKAFGLSQSICNFYKDHEKQL